MSFFNRFTGKKKTVESAVKAPKVSVAAKKEKQEVVKELPAEKIAPVAEQSAAEAAPAKKASRAYAVLLRPLVTEKTTFLQSENQYGFIVHPEANKSEVRRAVEARYNVHVINVNILNRAGKKVRFGRVSGVRRRVKKALVTVKPGEHIEIHQHV